MVLYISEIFNLAGAPKESVNEEEDEDEEVAWIFLFIDLVYVALLSKLSHVIEYCALSVHSFMFVITILTISFVSRLTIDDYACRFVTNDLVHRVAYFIYTMCNFIMTLNVNTHHLEGDDVGKDSKCDATYYSGGYSAGFIISRIVIVLLLAAVIIEGRFNLFPLCFPDL